MKSNTGKKPDKAVKKKILSFIYRKRETSKQEIARELSLSMPTVLQNVNELAEEGYVTEIGEYESTGGRRAKVLAVNPATFYTAGLDITKNHLSCVLLDAGGSVKKLKRIRLEFKDTPSYYKEVSELTCEFIGETYKEKIYGIGISLPGIIDGEQKKLVRSHILDVSQLSLRQFQDVFEWPLYFVNDANSAAYAEFRNHRENAVYLSLSDSVGGAVYMYRSIYPGDNFKSGEFGHMTVIPGGRQCYCGKKGCLDAYCSAKVLKEAGGGSLEQFFKKLKFKDTLAVETFDGYLDSLAVEIHNLRMAFDCDIMLGGYVGEYLEPYKTKILEKAAALNPFASDAAYIRIGQYKKEAAAVGAAMQFVEKFYEN